MVGDHWRVIKVEVTDTVEVNLVQLQAAEGGLVSQQMAQSRGAADVGRIRGVTFHIPAKKHTHSFK